MSALPGDPFGELEMIRRADRWRFVVDTLLGSLDDHGILTWMQTHGPDLDRMVAAAERIREGTVAT